MYTQQPKQKREILVQNENISILTSINSVQSRPCFFDSDMYIQQPKQKSEIQSENISILTSIQLSPVQTFLPLTPHPSRPSSSSTSAYQGNNTPFPTPHHKANHRIYTQQTRPSKPLYSSPQLKIRRARIIFSIPIDTDQLYLSILAAYQENHEKMLFP